MYFYFYFLRKFKVAHMVPIPFLLGGARLAPPSGQNAGLQAEWLQ